MTTFIAASEPQGRKSVALSSLKPGDTFRFAEIPFEDAITEGAFYRVYADPTLKEGRVAALSLDCKNNRHLDGDRLVYSHDIGISINP